MRVLCFSLLFDVRSSNSMTDMDTIGKVLSRAFIWAQLRLSSSNILEVIRVRSWGLLREHNIFFHYLIFNQSPKGIMRSAVPLPCFFDVVKSQKVAGQRPQQGTKSCRMGRNSVHPSARPSARPLFGWFTHQGVQGPARGV